jgi:hypothetical protein
MNEDKRRRTLRGIDRLAIGLFISLWGAFLLLQQAGIVQENVSMWPYALIYFGILVAVGGILRLSGWIYDK